MPLDVLAYAEGTALPGRITAAAPARGRVDWENRNFNTHASGYEKPVKQSKQRFTALLYLRMRKNGEKSPQEFRKTVDLLLAIVEFAGLTSHNARTVHHIGVF